MEKEKRVLEWVNNNNFSYDIWNNKYRYNNETFDEWLDRVSGGDLKIRQLIEEQKILFGGRILANRGIQNGGSMSNCYSHGYIEDSLDDIFDTNKNLAKTFKAEGGQGISLTKIRPEGCKIHNRHTSDGIVPFMKVFDTTVGSISQGNNRRGALLMSLDIWHKEASNFIKIKSDLKLINNANLSLEVDDEFMSIVADYYENPNQPKPIKHIKRDYNGNEIEYDVDVIALYKELCKYACKYAEPGILFVGPYREYILQQYHNEYKIETGNACSEQSLCKHGACNLMSFNLLEYVQNPFTKEALFDFVSFCNDIPVVVRSMDDIIDENMKNHPLKEQAEISRLYRNIGIGYMGLADALIALGIKYGSEEGVKFTEKITKYLFKNSVVASVKLARERGSFPKYDPCVWESDIIKNNFTPEEIADLKQQNCLRHAEILSVAPTGSIATMLNISSGIEPNFMWKYKRRTVSLNNEETIYEVNASIVDKYLKVNPNTALPDYFITAHDLNWNDRIKMQAAAQKAVDTAISSTCNLPKSTTTKEVEQIYLQAWKNKLKGFTIYVDGCRDSVLFNENSLNNTTTVLNGYNNSKKRPKKLEAKYFPVKAEGDNFGVIIGFMDDKPYEIFTIRPDKIYPQHNGTITKLKKCVYKFESDIVTLDNIVDTNISGYEKLITLLLSLPLRHNIEIKHITHTLNKPDFDITSFVSVIKRTLSKYENTEVLKDVCPECQGKLIRESGCIHCSECGYSKCGD